MRSDAKELNKKNLKNPSRHKTLPTLAFWHWSCTE